LDCSIGSIFCSPRSPDIIPLDFFLWLYITDIVNVSCVHNLPKLRVRIRHVIAAVSPDILDNTWTEIELRPGILCATSGSLKFK
jgi:hypothetical protein